MSAEIATTEAALEGVIFDGNVTTVESEEDKRARYAIHDAIWATSENGEYRRMTWEEAQEAGDYLWRLGYRRIEEEGK